MDITSNRRFTNELIHESSPYLLQHAHNPVNWLAWSSSSLEKAQTLNRLIVISIGYSACHWCHVMERESFEDTEVANIMNEHFVCIKVDREERPDIDQIYLEAVQLMTGQGGWPLNCITLPDGRPVFGGTYFPKENWKTLLQSVQQFWAEKSEETIGYAQRLTEGMQQMGLVRKTGVSRITSFDWGPIMKIWRAQIDQKNGGFRHAPKFPLPNSWLFLMRYAHYYGESDLLDHVSLTLTKMGLGGIYDQLGGGFSRYSTDPYWLVPHFEKMLYDNAQLLGLYAEAWQHYGNKLYLKIVHEIHSFISAHLKRAEGGYYSALDADSEGVEGKYYVWSVEEIASVLGSHSRLFNKIYQVSPGGNYEGKSILSRAVDDFLIAESEGIGVPEMEKLISLNRDRLLVHRCQRTSPGLDDKILCSWNALMVWNLAQAARICQDSKMAAEAVREMEFMLSNLVLDGRLMRTFKEGTARIDGFLDDHIFLAQALLEIYACTFEPRWALLSLEWMEKTLTNFYDPESGMFWYTQNSSEGLIARKQELYDNVIPSSTSVAARLLLRLSIIFDRSDYERISGEMLSAVLPQIEAHPPSFSNWSLLLAEQLHGLDQIVVVGRGAKTAATSLAENYLPFCVVLAYEGDSNISSTKIPLFQGKTAALDGNLHFYVCKGHTCNLPVSSISAALDLLDVGSKS